MKCFRLNEGTKSWKNFRDFVKIEEVGRLILPIIFILFSFSIVTSQVIVTLGDDIAICSGDNVKLTDLKPFVSGTNANSDIWWDALNNNPDEFNDTFSYPQAVSYTPSSNDIAVGYVTITLNAREFPPNGDVTTAEVKVFIRSDELFACNDNVIVPLNFHCEYKVTPPMLLEGEDSDIPYNLYSVDIFDKDGNVIPNDVITGDYIGQTLSYNVTHQCSWNACGGSITVRDNYHPIISCGNDTVTCQVSTLPDSLGFPIDTNIIQIDTIFRLANTTNKFIVQGWDACGDVELTYQDEVFKYDCGVDTVYQEKIIRKWKAVDESGNISGCSDTIMVKRIPVDDVILPPNWNNVDTNALVCDGDWLATALPNGNPSPDYTGWPELWSCSGIEYDYEDTEFSGCGNTFDVVRKWTIIDWCHTTHIVHYTQIIKIMDTLPPTLECRTDTVIIGSDAYDCNSELYVLDVPDVTDNCSSFSLFVKVYNTNTGDEVLVEKVNGEYRVQHLPLGLYQAEFTAIDECDKVNKCSYFFKVVDNMKPYMICDQHTKVNLGSNGEARIYPDKIDDGSFDNCEIVDMDIRKMTYTCDSAYIEYGEYVGFCCDETNQTIMVEMRATDASGNSNSCMVEVIIEDKLPPQITCPPDIIVSCDFYFNPDDLGRYFGTVVLDKSLRQDIIINDYYNDGIVGIDGYSYDNCKDTVLISEEFDINNCNIGEIYRTFTARDQGGRTNPCLQTITIYNPEPFNYSGLDITWPTNTSFDGCSEIQADTAITGAPVVKDNMCSMVAMRYDDLLFSVQGDACKKIVRTWTVRDWCQSDKNKWTHEQIIMLNNKIAPEFTSDCNDREVCVYGECKGLVELSASAEDDCTDASDLLWRWKLDNDNDGVYDEFGQDNHFSKVMDEGTYEIVWIVEDRCGNESLCNYTFTVKECKNPTPYCITDLTTVVMNQVGMVTIDAKKFNHGSSDNCTPTEDLKYSFSNNVNDTLYNITCDSLIGGVARTFYLKMWVTDNAGNQDYCSVILRVEDNNGVCPDTEGIVVSGKMTKWYDNKTVQNINVNMRGTVSEYNETNSSEANGRYEFENVPSAANYEITPQDMKYNCLTGVTTLDIVHIQKHILGIKKFDNPFQFIAADANKSKSISASDILAIRKMILGSTDKFKKNDCWVYVDAKQQLTKHDPYVYKTSLKYNNLINGVNDADFKVVKIGDVSGSIPDVIGSSNMLLRNENAMLVELGDVNMIKGENYNIPVYLESQVEGMQFTVDFDASKVSFEGFESQQINLSSQNFGYNLVDKGIVTFSWNGDVKMDVELPIFYLVFKAKDNGKVANNISINSDVTEALSITEGKELSIKLGYRNNDIIQEFKVFQNTPNPFSVETSIKFNIVKDETVSLEIFDLNGKIVYQKIEEFKKGINQYVVDNKDITINGVYYYTIKVDGDAITKKMIVIE